MERSSFAARSPVQRLTRTFSGGIGLGRAWEGFAWRVREAVGVEGHAGGAGRARRRLGTAAPARGHRARAGAGLRAGAAGGLGVLRDGLREGLRGGVRTLRVHRRARYLAIAVALGAPLLGGGWLWLRHSSLVRVEQVRISGVHGPQAAQIEAALRESARSMSTMDFKLATLREAVASRFPQVDELRAVASFPHSVRIAVAEQPPAAALVVNGVRTAVAADGVVLGTQLVSSSLPEVADNYQPAVGQRLGNPLVREALTVLGAAPVQLLRQTARAYFTASGLTVAMRSGMLVYFGDATRPHAKWLSLARVLADPSSASATYLDVRLPERPAAGLREGTGTTEGSNSQETTVQTLAHGLKTKKEQEEEAAARSAAESAAKPGGERSSEASSEHSSEAGTGAGGEGAATGAEAAAEPSG